MNSPLRPGKGGLLLSLRVTPKSSRDEVSGLHVTSDGTVSLAVKVTAVPDNGRANKAVIETLAKACRMPKSAFELVSGETERNKTILVTGNPAELEAWIARKVNAGKEN
ncbi:MAG: DUF167 domain-containing protein [Aestuariivirga sp.]|uniref:DUF167 family protein n=1 Tax=Aestuariivirga sp. TaxID=2650926 RepID=UPI0025BCC747|nr:DUF167 family protein [Aestuariivirga sp.]MCA3560170.1 DUF167 domain-containing protein [Aestuariivirga sp.]